MAIKDLELDGGAVIGAKNDAELGKLIGDGLRVFGQVNGVHPKLQPLLDDLTADIRKAVKPIIPSGQPPGNVIKVPIKLPEDAQVSAQPRWDNKPVV